MSLLYLTPGAERITTFAEYAKLVKGYFDRHYGLLILIGRPGLSKSWEFERQMENRKDAYLLRGIATPFKLFVNLYEHADEFVILDDAEIVWGEKEGRVLLRSLCEMKKPTTVSWEKANTWLTRQGYNNSFKTSSPVCLICNSFSFGKSGEFAAIADRGHIAMFDPSPQEVHKYAGKWFPKSGDNSQEVYDFIGQRLHYVPELSFRVYQRTLESLNAKRDWKRIFEESYCAAADLKLVIELENDKMLSPSERLAEYQQKARNNSKSVYYKYRGIVLRHQDDDGEVGSARPARPADE